LLTFLGNVYSKLLDGSPSDVDDRILAWSLVLGDISFDEAKAAAVRHLRTSKFQPVPADIIAAVKAMRPSKHPTAEEAWQEVLPKLNPYQRPEWSSELIREAVKTMGFLQICQSESPSIDRAQFLKIYNNLLERQTVKAENETVLVLAGMIPKMLGGSRQ
jgi:hypothetical protein